MDKPLEAAFHRVSTRLQLLDRFFISLAGRIAQGTAGILADIDRPHIAVDQCLDGTQVFIRRIIAAGCIAEAVVQIAFVSHHTSDARLVPGRTDGPRHVGTMIAGGGIRGGDLLYRLFAAGILRRDISFCLDILMLVIHHCINQPDIDFTQLRQITPGCRRMDGFHPPVLATGDIHIP